MKPCISSGTRRKSLPAEIGWDTMICAIVESAAEVRFLDPRVEEDRNLLSSFPSGIAFGPVAEVRWVLRRDGLHVVYMHDGGAELPGCESRAELAPLESETIFLWGRRAGESRELYEDRIPRVFLLPDDNEPCGEALCYPAGVPAPADQQRLRLRIQWYGRKVSHPVMTANGADRKETEERLFRWVTFQAGEDANA